MILQQWKTKVQEFGPQLKDWYMINFINIILIAFLICSCNIKEKGKVPFNKKEKEKVPFNNKEKTIDITINELDKIKDSLII